MAFVDPEQAEAARAAMEARYAAEVDAPGADGAVARSWPLMREFQAWWNAELARGTEPGAILEALARTCGSFLGSGARTYAVPGSEIPVLMLLLGHTNQAAAAGLLGVFQTFEADVHPGRPQ